MPISASKPGADPVARRETLFCAGAESLLHEFINAGGTPDRAVALFEMSALMIAGAGDTIGAAGHSTYANPAMDQIPAAPMSDGPGQLGSASKANPPLPEPSAIHSDAVGHANHAAKAIAVLPTAATETGRGHMFHADKANLPVPRPVSPLHLAAMGKVRQHAARTVLDSFRVRDGRAIGDVPWSSLDRLIADGGHEIALLRLLRDRGIPPNRNTPIRDLVSVREMEQLVQRAAEVSGADV